MIGFNTLMVGAVVLIAPLVVWLLVSPHRGAARLGKLLLLGGGAVALLRLAIWLPEEQRWDPGEELTLLARVIFMLVGLALLGFLHLEEVKED